MRAAQAHAMCGVVGLLRDRNPQMSHAGWVGGGCEDECALASMALRVNKPFQHPAG